MSTNMLTRLLLLLTCGFISTAVWSHGFLSTSQPRAGAVLANSPQQLTLEFSEELEPALLKLTLIRDERAVAFAKQPMLSSDGKRVTAALHILAAGKYRVEWAVVAKDGHRTKGAFEFVVRPTS